MLGSDEYWSEEEATHAGPGLSDDDLLDVVAERGDETVQSLLETVADAEPDTPDQSELQSLGF